VFPHRLELGEVQQSAVVYGLRLLAAALRADITRMADIGFVSPTREAMLAIIEGDAESAGILPGLGDPRQPFLRDAWVRLDGKYACSECAEPFQNEVDAMAHHSASGHRYSLVCNTCGAPANAVGANHYEGCHELPTSPTGAAVEVCETTSTPRLARGNCSCASTVDDMGPCRGYLRGASGNCVYCEHTVSCHMAAKACEGEPAQVL
jgi:hypothetical protein